MKNKIKTSLRKIKEQFGTRSSKVGSYSFLLTVLVLAILITVNVALNFFPDRYVQKDLTANQLYSLSSQSKVLLGTVEEDITIYWVVTSGNEDEYVEKLLHNYEDYCDRITVEKKDPDLNPDFTNAYTDETIYNNSIIVECGDKYRYISYEDIYETSGYSYYSSYISSVNIQKESPVNLVYKEDSGYCYSDAYTYYLKDGEEYKNLDNDNTKSTFTALTEFSWEECVDYHADASEMKSYGLDDPDAEVTVSYTDEDGEEQEFIYELAFVDESYYARIQDSRMVYRVSQEVYDTAENASYNELKPNEVILLDWDTVDSIDIESDGNLYTVNLESRGDDEYTYTFGGEEISFADVLEELSSVTTAEDLEKQPELGDNKEELVLTFHRNTDDYTAVELIFYQYDGSYCIPVLDGVQLDCVSREDVISLKEAINSVILDSENGE